MAGPDRELQFLTTAQLGKELQAAQHRMDMHRERAYKAVLQAQQSGRGKAWASTELHLLRGAEQLHREVLAALMARCAPYQVDTVEGITRDPEGQALVQAIINRLPE